MCVFVDVFAQDNIFDNICSNTCQKGCFLQFCVSDDVESSVSINAN